MGRKPKPFVPQCQRSGMCCTTFSIYMSPKKFREAYRNWRDNKSDTVQYDQIYLLYPMLAGRCKGKNADGSYVYGPCRNFNPLLEADGKPGCAIHEDRPSMCKGYPYYKHPQGVTMNTKLAANPAGIRGCGFNADPKHGKPLESFSKGLTPLTKDEM